MPTAFRGRLRAYPWNLIWIMPAKGETMGQNSTQLQFAIAGEITLQMVRVAEREQLDPETVPVD